MSTKHAGKYVTIRGAVLDIGTIREMVTGTPGHAPVEGQMDLLNDPVENPDAKVFIGSFNGYGVDGSTCVNFFSEPQSFNELA